MKFILCYFLLLFSMQTMEAKAGFVTVQHNRQHIVVTDSPAVRRTMLQRDRHLFKPPKRHAAGYGLLSLFSGLGSIAGVIAFLLLWPVSIGVGVALTIGVLLTGCAAIYLADLDSMNKRPHPVLNVSGFLLGFIAILPVLLPVSIFFSILAGFISVLGRRSQRRRSRKMPKESTAE
jgi:hypothetical protein